MNSLLYLLPVFGVFSSSRNLWSSMASSPFEEVDLKICVSLLPSDLDDIYGSIRLNIYKFLMRYNDAMGGVVLSVSGLSFEDGAKEGRIMDEMPHVHFDVKGRALVFRPKPGQILESRVNKVTSTHIGMLVCGIFNASVASKSMGNGLSFDTIAGEWRGPGDQVIAVGSTVRIVVIRMHEAAGLISIEGSLEGLPEADGEENGDHGGGSNSVLKKRQAGASEGDAAVATTVEASAKKSKKRAKSLGKVARSEL